MGEVIRFILDNRFVAFVIASAVGILIFVPKVKIISDAFARLMDKASSEPLPLWKRLAVLGLLAIVCAVPVIMSSPAIVGDNYSTGFADTSLGFFFLAVSNFLFFAAIAICLYLFGLYTHILTFSFTRPSFSGFQTRHYLLNIAILFALVMGTAELVAFFFPLIASMFGSRLEISHGVSVIVSLFVLQILLSYFFIWTPAVRSLVRRRLVAQNIPPAQMHLGEMIGISDPRIKKKSIFRWTEDDVGMLWLDGSTFNYSGDSESVVFDRQQFVSITRQSNSGSVEAYFGVVDVHVSFVTSTGSIRTLRLHPLSSFSVSGLRKAADDLERKLSEWAGVAHRCQAALVG